MYMAIMYTAFVFMTVMYTAVAYMAVVHFQLIEVKKYSDFIFSFSFWYN